MLSPSNLARVRVSEVIAILEAFNFDASALLTGKRPLSLFYFTLKLAQSTEVLRSVGACLLVSDSPSLCCQNLLLRDGYHLQ